MHFFSCYPVRCLFATTQGNVARQYIASNPSHRALLTGKSVGVPSCIAKAALPVSITPETVSEGKQ